jgi:YebC/PmpR family DNA-binding regulatory protein
MKLAKEIFVAAQMGGADPASNSNLRLAISKAKSKSMPSKNIKKAIDKAIGAKDEGANYDEYIYEGYLPGGVSVMINCLTDNHNRLAANVKSLFNKNGGSVAKTGAVSYLFQRLGIIEIDKSMTEEQIMDLIIENDPQDIQETIDSFVITCLPSSFNNIKEVLESNGITEFKTVEVKYIPDSLMSLSKEKTNKVINTINKFEDDEDIQEVFHNLDTSILDN